MFYMFEIDVFYKFSGNGYRAFNSKGLEISIYSFNSFGFFSLNINLKEYLNFGLVFMVNLIDGLIFLIFIKV